MFDSRVANDQLDTLRDREKLGIKRATIQHQRGAGPAVRGDELIHDADTGAHELVFRMAAGQGELGAINAGVIDIEERVTGRDFDGCGGAQSRSHRHLPTHEDVGTLDFVAVMFEREPGSDHIVAPIASRAEMGVIQVN